MIIKRYYNRKLYHQGAYLKLTDLEQLSFRGENYKVIEHDTGKDVTHEIQARIIANIYKTSSIEYLRDYLSKIELVHLE